MPIPISHLVPFVLASALLLVIPGPTIVMVVGQALAHGKRVALASVFGVGLGDLVAASLSLAGVGSVLAASAIGFTILKTAGALYLLYIAVTMWRAPAPDFTNIETTKDRAGFWRIFRDSFLVTVFNPKGIVFFIAFVPQFIDANSAFAPQAAVLVSIFVVLGIANAYAYITLADRAREAIRRPRIVRLVTRIGAGFLMSAGIASLFARRPV